MSQGEPDPAAGRPLLGVGFWVLMAVAFLCVLAGAGVALLGPKLWPPAPAIQPAPPPGGAPA